jgi:hypothetical protein
VCVYVYIHMSADVCILHACMIREDILINYQFMGAGVFLLFLPNCTRFIYPWMGQQSYVHECEACICKDRCILGKDF